MRGMRNKIHFGKFNQIYSSKFRTCVCVYVFMLNIVQPFSILQNPLIHINLFNCITCRLLFHLVPISFYMKIPFSQPTWFDYVWSHNCCINWKLYFHFFLLFSRYYKTCCVYMFQWFTHLMCKHNFSSTHFC